MVDERIQELLVKLCMHRGYTFDYSMFLDYTSEFRSLSWALIRSDMINLLASFDVTVSPLTNGNITIDTGVTRFILCRYWDANEKEDTLRRVEDDPGCGVYASPEADYYLEDF